MPRHPGTTARPGMLVLFGVGEYQLRLVRGAAAVFQQHGVPLIVFAEDATLPEASELLHHLLREHPPLGVLISPSTRQADHDRLMDMVEALGIPTVHVGEQRAGAISVTSDSESGMRAVMAHLLDERGITRPALVRGVPHQINSIEREQVFRDEMARRGLAVDEELAITGQYTYGHSYQAMSLLLQRRRDMDAVVALNDASAFGVMDALADAGLRVPEDVVVTGYDDERAAAMRAPGLTSVNQDVEGQAGLAASILLALARGAGEPADTTVPNRLVTRGSTGSGPSGAGAGSDALMDANRMLWSQLSTQEALLALNRAMFRCRTVGDVTEALTSCLERLGIVRCELAVYDPPAPGQRPTGSNDRLRVLLDYRGRTSVPPAVTVRSVADMLDELGPASAGTTFLMPLSGLDHDLGVVTFEQREGAGSVVEVLRHDLSRALESVFGAQERDRYTANLERLVAERTRNLQLANTELERLAHSDGLTRIANRSSFELQLRHEWAAHLATGRELALIMVDVDYFKAYNDHYGHVPGDNALRTVAECLERAVHRRHDLAARYGGEEFAVLLPDSGVEAATFVARRFQKLLAEAAIPHAASEVAEHVTASIGIAAMRPSDGETAQSIVHAADRTLYRAKRAGRNQVAVEPPAGSAGSDAAPTLEEDRVSR